MKRKITILISLIVITLFGVGGWYFWPKKIQTAKQQVAANTIKTPQNKDCSVNDAGVLNELNRLRSQNKVPTVSINPTLDNYSNNRSLTLNGILDNHAQFKTDVSTPDKFPRYSYMGEVLGKLEQCSNSAQRVDDFRTSRAHWDALMDARFTEIGVGFDKGVLVINLGEPK